MNRMKRALNAKTCLKVQPGESLDTMATDLHISRKTRPGTLIPDIVLSQVSRLLSMLGLKMTTRGACADTTAMVKQIVKLLLSNQMMRKKKKMKAILEKTVTMKKTIMLEKIATMKGTIMLKEMIMKMLLTWSTLLNNSTESGRDLIGMNKNLQGHSIK